MSCIFHKCPIYTYTSSYVGLMPICHVGSTRSLMSYGNPEYQKARGPAAHRLHTRYAPGSHEAVFSKSGNIS